MARYMALNLKPATNAVATVVLTWVTAYRKKISKQKFTPKGWESFRDAMIKSGLVKNVLDSQQVVTSAPIGIPVLSQEGIIKGVYSWVFSTKILITFRAGSAKRNSTKRVLVTLQEMPTEENPYGVGISEFYIY